MVWATCIPSMQQIHRSEAPVEPRHSQVLAHHVLEPLHETSACTHGRGRGDARWERSGGEHQRWQDRACAAQARKPRQPASATYHNQAKAGGHQQPAVVTSSSSHHRPPIRAQPRQHIDRIEPLAARFMVANCQPLRCATHTHTHTYARARTHAHHCSHKNNERLTSLFASHSLI